MATHVEFYGIPRARAGTARTSVEADDLGAALRTLADRLPEFGATCVDGERLRPGYVANLDGERFVVDPRTPLLAEVSLLILSTDAGG